MKYFFEEITEIKIINPKLQELEFDEEEIEYLLSLARSIAHHKVIDMILTELEESHKESFLERLAENHKWKELALNLKNQIKDFEGKVAEKVREVEEELLSLIIE